MSLTLESLSALGITKEDIVTRAAELVMEPDDGESVRSLIINEVKKEFATAMRKAAESKIDNLLSEVLSGMVDAPFQPVDEWGDRKGKTTSLRELVKTKALDYLTEKVGTDGKPGYNATMTRALYLARKAADDAMTYEVKKEIDAAVSSAKVEIQKKVADYITQVILKK